MNRVEAAIEQGRCVLAIGGNQLAQSDILAELRRRNVPVVVLGGDPVSPAVAPSAETLAPVLENEGGVLVLVEPNPGTDGRALGEIDRLVKGGRHKPRLAVVARAFNPFGLPMSMRLLKFEQIKKRAIDFLSLLPAGAPAVAPVAVAVRAAAPAADRILAPRPEFVGREDEQAALVEMLQSDGGPIVVHGPPGVGRSWLVHSAVEASGLEAAPELILSGDSNIDTLLGRFAILARAAGDDRLHDALTGAERPLPTDLAALVAEVAAGEALAGKVWVIHGLHRLLHPNDASFWRDGRLEMVLTALLTSTPSVRLVFISDAVPVFYREGVGVNLRTLSVGGLKGRELHELFDAYQAPEFSRDRFGPIQERVHGHPLAARTFALAVRDSGDVEELIERARFLKAEDVGDISALKKELGKRVAALDDELRAVLVRVAHLLYPATPEVLQVLGLNRKTRLRLLAAGVLDQTPGEGHGRTYSVHPLVRVHLNERETSDFDTLALLADFYLGRARTLKTEEKMVESFAMAQEGNRLMIAARKGRGTLRLPYADHDAVRASVREMMGRRRNPRLDIARMRLNEARKADPTSPEMFILDGQLRVAEQAKKGAIREVFDEGAAVAPVPELFHADANRHRRKDRKKALGALERGVSVFPDDGRLHRRLGGLYLSLGRADDAIRVLKKAQELEPMMPDSYSLLGELWAARGPEHWDDAAASLDEALRLAPEDPHHKARKADLLRRRARFTPDLAPEARDAQLADAETLLREALVADAGSWKIQTLLAGVILDRAGDLEQAEWLLKKALKSLESVEALTERARVLVRRQAFPEARQLLERAAKKQDAYHPAFAVLGEVELGQGQVFLAFEAYKKAVEAAGEGAAEAPVYTRRMQELGAMIESGVAAELLKQAQGDLVQATDAGVTDGPRRDAGSTTILRKREQEAAAAAAAAQAQVATGAAPVAAPVVPESAEAVAEAAAEAAAEGPSESASEEPTVEVVPAAAEPAAVAAPVVVAETPAAEPAPEA